MLASKMMNIIRWNIMTSRTEGVTRGVAVGIGSGTVGGAPRRGATLQSNRSMRVLYCSSSGTIINISLSLALSRNSVPAPDTAHLPARSVPSPTAAVRHSHGFQQDVNALATSTTWTRPASVHAVNRVPESVCTITSSDHTQTTPRRD